ncbi:alpha/beta hydrolase [Terasakiella sp. SH-1]|uniref:alpha/beta fold hydrolase n=1 Tax=Terasakiella sp. SH-1 TaxID=2560057 RepID=UPI001073FDD3|nr:alpha/beta hydrolase [Terasakiella sp. SH-1]
MRRVKPFTLLCLLVILSACQTVSLEHRVHIADKIAQQTNLVSQTFKTTSFDIFSLKRHHSVLPVWTVYIEGDGFAWVNRRTISSNPTPLNPIGMKLSALDAVPNLLYLARPCQYVDLTQQKNCTRKIWTSHRFSKEVLSSYQEILDHLKGQYHLVGFSGGGAIASLLAATRSDVLSLRTIAGNLDHEAINTHHNVSPISHSLNPVDYIVALENIPQIHYAGKADRTIPPWVADGFAKRFSDISCIEVIHTANTSHTKGWETFWVTQVTQIPSCQVN